MKSNVMYAIPKPAPGGGMTAISFMYYQYGVFKSDSVFHFDTTYTVGKCKILRFFQFFSLKFKFYKALKRNNIDVVYVMTSSFIGFYDKCFYCLIAKLLHKKSVLNPVGGALIAFYESNFINSFLVRSFIKAPDHIIVGNTSWQKYFKEEFKIRNLSTVPNPIISNLYQVQNREWNQPSLQVLFLATLTESKGVLELLKIIKNQDISNANIHFSIVGMGDLFDFCKSELSSLIEKGTVTVPGYISEEDKKYFLRKAHLFILPTHFEVMPISILEAMAASLPIISTNVGGVPDAVINGVNGYIFEPKDTEGMIQSILALNKNRLLLSNFGEKSKEFCDEKFDLQVILNKHNAIFKSIIDN